MTTVKDLWGESKTTEEGLAIYDGLPAVTVDEMIGQWAGSELPSGHALDGVLEVARWHGKVFRDADSVDPLVHKGFAGRFAVNPSLMPLGLAMHAPFLRNRLTTFLFLLSQPIIATQKPRARLRMVECRGVVSATMIYDAKPINDHFRKVSDDEVIGLMDVRGMEQPYFFALKREA
ncbi:MAG: DUF4334 domain-containing protein [Pseudomonadota bacterium]